MDTIKKTVLSGKINSGNKKLQSSINVSVLGGFVLLFAWIHLYKKTFIDLKILLSLVLLPALALTPFLFKKYVVACGYTHFLKGKKTYNAFIRILVFVLIAMPVGNLAAFAFLSVNHLLADEKTQLILVNPDDVCETTHKGRKYTSYEIHFDGISKNLRAADKSPDDIKNAQLKMKMRKGFLGYWCYDSYTIENTGNKW